MQRVVPALTRRDLYKTMTRHADHQVQQDVYHEITLEAVPTCWRKFEELARPKSVYLVQTVDQLGAPASGWPVSAIRSAGKRNKSGSRSF
jgi:Motility quorum-sensing regulator, toxin of MqsA